MKVRAIVPHIAALVVVVGCAWLTQWQVDRAAQKRELIERWHDRSAVPVDALEAPYSLPQPVTGVAIWKPDRQLLLDNKIRNGRPGVHVLTPLQLQDGRLFLVNRGWAAWPSRSARLPDPELTRSQSEIRGVLNTPPGTGLQLGSSEIPLDDDWPLLATYFDYTQLADVYGDALQPAVIQLDPSHADHLTGDAWNVVTFGPKRHIGYALTWSSIAIVVAIIWVALTIRQRRRGRVSVTENDTR